MPTFPLPLISQVNDTLILLDMHLEEVAQSWNNAYRNCAFGHHA